MSLYLSNAEWLAELKRVRALIAGGLKLDFDDNDTPGNKSTECSWGLPNPLPGIIRYRTHGQFCPLDKRPMTEGHADGCFYHCRLFQARPNKGIPVPTREEALAFYDAAIEFAKGVQ
jgi:hypothetical protein